jgi:hypothetical protein
MANPLAGRYRDPRLAADSVVAIGAASIELKRGSRLLILSIEGSRDEALVDLRKLCSHSASSRRTLWRKSKWPSTMAPLFQELDASGWIVEGAQEAGSPPATCLDDVKSELWRALDQLGSTERQDVRAVMERALRQAQRIPSGASPRWKTLEEGVTVYTLSHLLVESPHATRTLVRSFLGHQERVAVSASSWPTDMREVEIGISCALFWARQSVRSPTLLPSIPSGPRSSVITGDAAIRETEAVLREWEAAAGPPKLIGKQWSKIAARRIAQGIHLQQYYVSLRYVDSVLPAARLCYQTELRRLVWRYLQEELGHEQYEMDACRSLGLSEDDVRSNVALPAFSAFHRVIACTSGADVLSWMLSIPLAEGLPYEVKPLPSFIGGLGLQDARLSAHVALDSAMDHAWIPRKMLHQFSSLEVDEWRTAMRKVGLVWALARAGWDQLVAHFGESKGSTIAISPWQWLSEEQSTASSRPASKASRNLRGADAENFDA